MIEIGIHESIEVKGGVSAYCLQDFWGYVKRAFDFIMEYQDEIIKGLKKGWNKF